MPRLLRISLLTTLLLAITSPSIASAQSTHTREGFWFNIGLGAGSLGCSDCDERVAGLSGGLALGGTINKHWLLGAFSNGWTKSEDGVTVTAGTLVVGARFYPSETGGFFLTGGLGIGTVDLAIDGFGSASELGTGALLGLGFDIRVASSVSFTPFWNGVGISFSGGDANIGQIGLGITIH